MSENKRETIVPQQHIRDLFDNTRDGKLAITYYDPCGKEEVLTHEMEWTAVDAEAVVQRYESLIAMLNRFGQLHDELEDPANREKLLTDEEREAWDTYLRPFEPFEEDEAVVAVLFRRGEFDELDEEDNALLERYCEWRDAQSLKRLPFCRRSPVGVILRAQWYEWMVSLNAPKIVINDEARCLAEEMVLYFGGKKGAF